MNNRRIANLFVWVNFIMLFLGMAFAIGGSVWTVLMTTRAGLGTFLFAAAAPLLSIFSVLMMCGLAAVLIEIMRSLRRLEEDASGLRRALTRIGDSSPAPSPRVRSAGSPPAATRTE